jgi:hypothetical protein
MVMQNILSGNATKHTRWEKKATRWNGNAKDGGDFTYEKLPRMKREDQWYGEGLRKKLTFIS